MWRSMKRSLAILFVSQLAMATVLTQGILAQSQDASVLDDFKELAQQHFDELQSDWKELSHPEVFLLEAKGVPLPMTLPKKYSFQGLRLESAPEVFSYDVERTNSLVSPYVAHIEFPLVLLFVKTHAKGPSKACNGRTLSMCLKNGGKIVETTMLYKNTVVRKPQTFKYYYEYRNDSWTPKVELRAALQTMVHGLDIAQPFLAQDAPDLLLGGASSSSNTGPGGFAPFKWEALYLPIELEKRLYSMRGDEGFHITKACEILMVDNAVSDNREIHVKSEDGHKYCFSGDWRGLMYERPDECADSSSEGVEVEAVKGSNGCYIPNR